MRKRYENLSAPDKLAAALNDELISPEAAHDLVNLLITTAVKRRDEANEAIERLFDTWAAEEAEKARRANEAIERLFDAWAAEEVEKASRL